MSLDTAPAASQLPPDPFLSPSVLVNRWVVLAIVGLAQFMVVLDSTIVNVAMPSIQLDLDMSATGLQWVVNSYTLVFGGFLLLGGRLADVLGRRRLFVAGISLFTLASLVNGFAASGEVLIIARGVQGLGAALVSPAALSIILALFHEGPERTRALGIWGAIAAGGSAVGLLLGGMLTEWLSWEWAFYINVPIGIALVVVALARVPESRDEQAHPRFDIAGAATVTLGLIALVYAIVNTESAGWLSGETAAFAGAAAILLGSFVAIQLRLPAPLVRLGIFRRRSLAVANVAMLFMMAAMFAMFFFGSIYLQQVLGYGPLRAGLAFLPVSAAIIFGAGLSTTLVGKVGVRVPATVGPALAAVGMLWWSFAGVESTYLMNVLPPLLLLTFGMGMSFVPATLVATTGIDEEDSGLASGVFNTSQQIGGALGLAVLATVASSVTTNQLEGLGRIPQARDQMVAMVDGFSAANLVAAGLLVAASLMYLLLIRRSDVAAVDQAGTGAGMHLG